MTVAALVEGGRCTTLATAVGGGGRAAGRPIMFVFRFSIDHRHYSAVCCAAYEAPETGAALVLATRSPRRAAKLSGTMG